VCKKYPGYSDFGGVEDDLAYAREKALADALGDFKVGNKELNPKSIGKILKYRKDRIVGGLKLEYDQLKEAWRVKSHI